MAIAVERLAVSSLMSSMLGIPGAIGGRANLVSA